VTVATVGSTQIGDKSAVHLYIEYAVAMGHSKLTDITYIQVEGDWHMDYVNKHQEQVM
jgi:hypothetical protein